MVREPPEVACGGMKMRYEEIMLDFLSREELLDEREDDVGLGLGHVLKRIQGFEGSRGRGY